MDDEKEEGAGRRAGGPRAALETNQYGWIWFGRSTRGGSPSGGRSIGLDGGPQIWSAEQGDVHLRMIMSAYGLAHAVRVIVPRRYFFFSTGLVSVAGFRRVHCGWHRV